jgi:multiple sugar transport system permease protein
MDIRTRYRIQRFFFLGASLAPATVILMTFFYASILFTFWISFHSWNVFTPMRWVGLDNYVRAVNTDLFWHSLRITGIFVLVAVPACVILGLIFGILLKNITFGRAFYRLMLFIPVITSMVVAAVVWKWILNSQIGLANYLLGFLGLEGPNRPHWMNWLNDTRGGALAGVLLVGIWQRIGYNGVLFLAGLNNVPVEYQEAAKIDGAGPWRRFWLITFPLLSPTTFFVVVLQVISAFKVIVSVYVMTQGGPDNSTHVIVFYMWSQAFRYFRMGYGSMLGIVVLLIVLMFTLLQFKVAEKRVHYQ